MRLIGINGFKRSGKDTTAQIIAQESEGVVIRRAFADKLKIIAARALGFERDDADLIALMDSFKETAMLHARYGEPNDPDPPNYLHDLTGRQYLQWFGEHARSVFGDTLWIDQVLPSDGLIEAQLGSFSGVSQREASRHQIVHALQTLHGMFDVLTVTDVRYPNEAERVLNLGGEVWEVKRPGCESDGHSTEIPLAPELVTVTINNDGSLDDLRAKVRRLI